jgi:Tol biopolymer transport system component
MDNDGSNLKLLSGTQLARWPSVSPDSKWVIYSAFGGKNHELVKVQLDGTQGKVLVSKSFLYGSTFSPDGKLIAYAFEDLEKSSSNIFLNIISSDGGAILKNFTLPVDTFPGRFHWTPDGAGIAYIVNEQDGSIIFVQMIKGSPPRRLTNVKGEVINNFSYSQDGKWIAFSRGKRNSDIVLIQDVP